MARKKTENGAEAEETVKSADIGKADATPQKKDAKFTKKQLIRSARFAKRRDALSVALTDGTEYTVAEAEAALDKFLKGKVK